MKRIVLENYLTNLFESEKNVTRIPLPPNKLAKSICWDAAVHVLLPTLSNRLKICDQYKMKSFQLYTEKKKRKLELCKLREYVISFRIYENYLKQNISHCKKDEQCKKQMSQIIIITKRRHEEYFRELVQKSEQYNIGPREVNTGS